MTPGEKVRELRLERNETRLQLAVAIGYKNVTSIYNFESGKTRMSEFTLGKMAEHFGKTIEYFQNDALVKTERQQLRSVVNDYCVDRTRNYLPCKCCKHNGTPLCESEAFWNSDLKRIRAAVESLQL